MHEVNAGAGCPSYDVVVRGLSCPLELVRAASRKTHSFAGEFDIPLPVVTPQPGVECRNSAGGHSLVVTFSAQVTSGNASVIAGVGSAGAPTFSGTTMTIPLSGVADMQKITVLFSGVTSSLGQVLSNTAVSMNLLVADTNRDKSVNSGDALQTRNRSGQAVSAGNFRSDVNTSGTINSGDAFIVRARSGNSSP